MHACRVESVDACAWCMFFKQTVPEESILFSGMVEVLTVTVNLKDGTSEVIEANINFAEESSAE